MAAPIAIKVDCATDWAVLERTAAEADVRLDTPVRFKRKILGLPLPHTCWGWYY